MKVLKNYLFNVFYQLLILIIPLITLPYITRIFSPEQIGINAYTFSVSQYFVLFAGLGVGLYGNRTLAYVKGDEEKRVKVFWSILFAIIFTSIVSFIVYWIYVVFIVKENRIIYMLQSIYIFSVALDVSWLFMAMEDFKKIVTRNTIVKLLGVVSIFLFVKSDQDLNLYVLILALTHFLGICSMWIYVKEYIKYFDFDISAIKYHFFPLIKVYIPQVAIQVYVIMDKTMIGLLANEAEVGYYDMSQKIVKIIMTLLTSLGVVMIPHMTSLISEKKYKQVERNIGITFKYMSYFAFPMAFGLSAISMGITNWFFGEAYVRTGILMSFSSFIIIAITWSNILGMQLLMPMMKEKEFTISVIAGAMTNIITNIILIPNLGSFGAIIGTIVAEFTVTIVQIILVNKYINVIPYIVMTWKNLIASGVMFLIIFITTSTWTASFITTTIQVFIGILTYLIVMFILKSDVQQSILDKVVNIITLKLMKKRINK